MAVSKARFMARRIGILGGFGLAVLAFTVMGSSQVAGASNTTAPVSHYVVQTGDTLWAIAAQEVPNGNQADFVAKLVDLNQLQTSVLMPGQDLILPNN
ncbi:MAG: LysM peptidoglycan-binding domain-containing protein [Micrococcales bacterium]